MLLKRIKKAFKDFMIIFNADTNSYKRPEYIILDYKEFARIKNVPGTALKIEGGLMVMKLDEFLELEKKSLAQLNVQSPIAKT